MFTGRINLLPSLAASAEGQWNHRNKQAVVHCKIQLDNIIFSSISEMKCFRSLVMCHRFLFYCCWHLPINAEIFRLEISTSLEFLELDNNSEDCLNKMAYRDLFATTMVEDCDCVLATDYGSGCRNTILHPKTFYTEGFVLAMSLKISESERLPWKTGQV